MPSLPQENPDIVLMDINLPGISGIDCVRQLKPALPNTQFVMLTVYNDADHIFQALTGGATGYLLKQTQREELLTALKDVYAGGSPMTSSIARKVGTVLWLGSPGRRGFITASEGAFGSVTQGYMYKEVADAMKISTTTVNTYIRRIYEKLHVQSRSQAVAKSTWVCRVRCFYSL